jgi:4-hydroxy-tetrahydrodipicolinate synthase
MTFPSGTYTVLVTPFTEDNKVDYSSINNWLKMQYQNDKIVGLILLGTTSESPTLRTNEKKEIINFVSEYNKSVDNKKVIIAGVGGNDTLDVIEFTNDIKECVNGIMVTVPHYNKPPQRGIVEHFKLIANHFQELPIMMYNVPSRAGVNMEPETIVKIIQSCPNVVGLKETNLNNVPNFVNLIENTDIKLGQSFKLFSGDDINTVEYCKFGASGVISVASNVIPNKITSVVSLCLNEELYLAENELSRISDFLKYLFVESNPIPVKDIMCRTNIYKNNLMRLPLVSLEKEKSDILFQIYNDLTQNNKK